MPEIFSKIQTNPAQRSSEAKVKFLDKSVTGESNKNDSRSFFDHLKDSVENVNTMQRESDSMAALVASGKKENLHETMIAVTQAELSFNLMVQVRNKALEAYQEVMRMTV